MKEVDMSGGHVCIRDLGKSILSAQDLELGDIKKKNYNNNKGDTGNLKTA